MGRLRCPGSSPARVLDKPLLRTKRSPDSLPEDRERGQPLGAARPMGTVLGPRPMAL